MIRAEQWCARGVAGLDRAWTSRPALVRVEIPRTTTWVAIAEKRGAASAPGPRPEARAASQTARASRLRRAQQTTTEPCFLSRTMRPTHERAEERVVSGRFAWSSLRLLRRAQMRDQARRHVTKPGRPIGDPASWLRTCGGRDYMSPTTCPSGSANRAIVVSGATSVSGMITRPPLATTLSSAPCGSSVWT